MECPERHCNVNIIFIIIIVIIIVVVIIVVIIIIITVVQPVPKTALVSLTKHLLFSVLPITD